MQPAYPADEFLRDYDTVQKQFRDLPDDTGLMQTAGIVLNHMAEKYGAGPDTIFRNGRFMLIMMYVSEHINDFDSSDFAVNGSEKVGALVGEHLLKAIHEIVMTNVNDLDKYTPAEVMELASKYRDEKKG